MRLLVNCPSGESRLLQVDAEAKVSELKQVLQEAEGILLKQQVLSFAGMDLKDHLTLADHRLEDYSLSDEIVLYLSQRLASPLNIYVTSRFKPSQMHSELVESDMPVGEMMNLLETRGYAAAFDKPTAQIFVKRADGSNIKMSVDPAMTIDMLIHRISEMEKVVPKNLTFLQAQDGHLHVSIWPSVQSVSNTSVYARNVAPQEKIPIAPTNRVKSEGLPKLVKELCVLP
uniref:Ubiquitin-like domain-containing protein n=1 Tax=Polytomella parva TaxID=51329 RepID=A0A7S0YSY3_9CHLO|mmetsp:Transcript_8236/g.15899  ORF Transcript_8236/g.15899 Transcript_8236/m.15899 type:complete len:229 (+) Transcript_8236:106-792(+)